MTTQDRIDARAVGKRLQQFFNSPEIHALAPPATRTGLPWTTTPI
jgi:hypothetical protein